MSKVQVSSVSPANRTSQIGDLALEFISSGPGMGSRQVVSITGDWNTPSHFHTDYELHYLERGSARISADSRLLDIGPGDFCLIPPQCAHYSVAASEDVSHLTFGFALGRRTLAERPSFSEYEYYRGLFGTVKSAVVYSGSPFLQQCFRRIGEVRGMISGPLLQMTEALLRLIFMETAEITARARAETGGEPPRSGEPMPDRGYGADEDLRRRWTIDNLISENYMEELSYDRLAGELGLSRRQCIRVVRRLTGMTLQELLTKQRMSMAKMLMNGHGLTLGEVALRVGYDSYSGFFTAFRKYYGVSPAAGAEK